MKYIYTATFVPNEDETKYYCRVPDLPGCITTAGSIDEAIELITDAASGWLVVAEDEGNIIPAATPQHMLDIPENVECPIFPGALPPEAGYSGKRCLFYHPH